MSTKTKKVTAKTVPAPALVSKQSNDISNNLIGVTDAVLKSVAVLAASIIHSSPQFAFQTNQTSVVQLSDIFFQYMSGAINMNSQEPQAEAPKFG